MAQVLLAWELGSGLGHLMTILPFARELSQRGQKIFLALKDLSQAEKVFASLDVAYLQAPTQTRTARHQILPPVTFAHILHNIGFGDLRELRTRVEAWRHVYQYVKPDLIVFDHSPTALLAATGVGAKRVLVGTVFSGHLTSRHFVAFDHGCSPTWTALPRTKTVSCRMSTKCSHLGDSRHLNGCRGYTTTLKRVSS